MSNSVKVIMTLKIDKMHMIENIMADFGYSNIGHIAFSIKL